MLSYRPAGDALQPSPPRLALPTEWPRTPYRARPLDPVGCLLVAKGSQVEDTDAALPFPSSPERPGKFASGREMSQPHMTSGNRAGTLWLSGRGPGGLLTVTHAGAPCLTFMSQVLFPFPHCILVRLLCAAFSAFPFITLLPSLLRRVFCCSHRPQQATSNFSPSAPSDLVSHLRSLGNSSTAYKSFNHVSVPSSPGVWHAAAAWRLRSPSTAPWRLCVPSSSPGLPSATAAGTCGCVARAWQ